MATRANATAGASANGTDGNAGGGASADGGAISAMATATRPEAAAFHHNWGLGLKNNFFFKLPIFMFFRSI